MSSSADPPTPSSDREASQAEASKAANADAEASRAHAVTAEAVKGEAVKGEAVKGEAVKGEVSMPAGSKTESSRPGASKPSVSKVESSKAGTSKGEVSKLPASKADASKQTLGKRPRFDWMQAGGDGVKGPALKAADILKKEETRQAVSSIRSKLSAPKAAAEASSLLDQRKNKVGSLSAGLTREQIRQSQEHHREKMEALGKPVPSYRNH